MRDFKGEWLRVSSHKEERQSLHTYVAKNIRQPGGLQLEAYLASEPLLHHLGFDMQKPRHEFANEHLQMPTYRLTSSFDWRDDIWYLCLRDRNEWAGTLRAKCKT